MIEFTEQHVGLRVWHPLFGNGVIVEYNESNYPIEVKFSAGLKYFTSKGYFRGEDTHRMLFVGHDLEMTVNEEPLPEPEPVCPFCGVVHEIMRQEQGYTIKYAGDNEKCPLFLSFFGNAGAYTKTLGRIKEYMKNA